MKHTSYRIAAVLFAVLLFVSCLMVPVSASPGAIHSIDITARLDHKGNAKISEIWDVTVPDDWTELYTVKSNLGTMKILHFQAEDLNSGKKFISMGTDWNVNASRSRKAGRSGIHENDDGDLELCWGVGSSGHHRYKISYEMTNMVQDYTDGYDGFNVRFVNEGLSSKPERVKVTITGPEAFTKNNTAMWGFGYQGQLDLQSGAVVTQSSGDVNYCNILVRYTDGLFTPTAKSKKSFASIQKKAMRHSDYSHDRGLGAWEILGIGALIAIIAAFFFIGRGRRNDPALVTGNVDRSKLKDPPYSRELPFDGSLEETYLVLQAVESHVPDSRIMSAYLLKWFEHGWIRIDRKESGRWSLFGEKSQAEISFGNPDMELSSPEQKLWDILQQASGEDHKLQEKELYNWSKGNYDHIEEFYNAVDFAGRETGTDNSDIGLVPKRVLLTNQEVSGLTEHGAERAVSMMGFKKYLKDFTIINERQARDVGLWKDYLIFAALFGIADEVAKEFKDILPGYFAAPTEDHGAYYPDWDAFDVFYFLNMMDHVSTATYSGYVDGMPSESASSGLGGFTSVGGGGGFSGGGFGGGGR